VSHDFGRAVQERVVEESRDNAGTQRDLKTVRRRQNGLASTLFLTLDKRVEP
jgi:hypothetical protein